MANAFSNLKITAKILILAAIGTACTVLVAAYSLVHLKATMIEDRKVAVRQVVETTKSVAEHYYGRFKGGELTEDEARDRAKAAIRALRYGNNDYMFAYNVNGITEIHGTRKELEGKQRIDEKDGDGFLFIRAQIAAAQAGGGFTTYRFTKPGAGTDLYEKISYNLLFAPWNWVVSSGVYMDDIETAFRAKIYELLAVLGVLMVFLGTASVLLGRVITRPITHMADAMHHLAQGDLTVAIQGAERRDEIGGMAQAVQVFKDNAIRVKAMEVEQEQATQRAAAERHQAMMNMAASFETAVMGLVSAVSSQASELRGTAQEISTGAGQAADQAANVAAAAQQATVNVQTVASASEELGASISEISRQVAEAASVSATAAEEAAQTNAVVEGLAQAASKIGEVVGLINTIASQTNLLALNATIEAARAGDAGKGFAVVAGEVKNLANQTSRATEEISAQISAVQTETQRAVGAIRKIGTVIDRVKEISSSIASAVEEQGAATMEISRNVQEAAKGTENVSANIGTIAQAAQSSVAAANNILSASGNLAENSENLRSEVVRFLDGVRAG